MQKLTAGNPNLDISIHLSPGTPSMTAVSILLGKTKYNTRFVQATKDKGGEFVSIPFDISAEFGEIRASRDQGQVLQSSITFVL